MATYDPPQPLWKRNIAGILDFLFCLAIFGPSLNLAFGVSRHPVVVTNSAGAMTTNPLFSLSGWPALICIRLMILYLVVLGRSGERLFRMRRREVRMKKALSSRVPFQGSTEAEDVWYAFPSFKATLE